MHIYGLWEEGGGPGENMQTPHKKAPSEASCIFMQGVHDYA